MPIVLFKTFEEQKIIMNRSTNSTPVKIIISMLVFASALYLAWAGYQFGQWLKHATG